MNEREGSLGVGITIVTRARSENEKQCESENQEARLNKSLGSKKRKSIKKHLDNG